MTGYAFLALASFWHRFKESLPELMPLHDVAELTNWSAEFERTTRDDQQEETTDRLLSLLHEEGARLVEQCPEVLRPSLASDAEESRAWYDRFGDFRMYCDFYRAVLDMRRNDLEALDQPLVRIRGFCAPSAHECFAFQLAELEHRLDHHRGKGLPVGGQLLGMLQEWALSLRHEGRLLKAYERSKADVDDSFDFVETWILDVLRQEPSRCFKRKDILAARRRSDQRGCPVERSSLSDALARLRERGAVRYATQSYSHKPL